MVFTAYMHVIAFLFLHCSDVMVTSIDSDITFEGICAEMKDICRFDEEQPFTMKWVDEEGEICTLCSVLSSL